MEYRKNENRSNIKITYSELMKEVDKYESPYQRGRIFTKEQDDFIRKARQKKMGCRQMKVLWERCWDKIGRESLSKRIIELKLK